ncbi:MAG: hypothetical protein CM1200mP30_18500 [Pseudomonadota bacterium]|nr:MAG: hypothetical protein CM1200mP30_18500 [Pseudomonadota bacterium]
MGPIPEFVFEPKDHVDLMEVYLIDFDGGAKVSGQKFYFLKNQAVFLELALEIMLWTCCKRKVLLYT